MIQYLGSGEFNVNVGGTLTNEGTKVGGINGVFKEEDLSNLLDELKNTSEFGTRINTAEEYEEDQTTAFNTGYQEGINDTEAKYTKESCA